MGGRTNVQGMFLGPTGSVASFNESALPTALAGQLGKIFWVGDKAYRLVKFDNGAGNVAAADGHVAYWKEKSSYTATSDVSDGEATINGICGAFLMAVTDGNYCFIQCAGDQTKVKVAASTAVSDTMIGSSTDGTLARMPAANATYDGVPAAVALSAVDTGTSTVRWLPSILA